MYATKPTKASEAIACLKEYFKNYSKPKQIVAGKGSSFRSQEIYDFMNKYNI